MMIITLENDNGLIVYESTEQLKMSVEALDVEEVLRDIFDDTSQRYAIKWIRPNKTGKSVFGLLRTFENGEYYLVPVGEKDPDGLKKIINSAKYIEPESKSEFIYNLLRRLENDSR